VNIFSFETFITPKIIHVVFAVGLLVIALVALVEVIVGLVHFDLLRGVVLPIIGMLVAGLIWRVYCEIILVFFDMRDKLAEIAHRPRV
jgi:hypothetical protein